MAADPQQDIEEREDPAILKALAATAAIVAVLEARSVGRILRLFEQERSALAGRLLLPGQVDGPFRVRQSSAVFKTVLAALANLQHALPTAGTSAIRGAAETGAATGLEEVGAIEAARGSAATARAIVKVSFKIEMRPDSDLPQVAKFLEFLRWQAGIERLALAPGGGGEEDGEEAWSWDDDKRGEALLTRQILAERAEEGLPG